MTDYMQKARGFYASQLTTELARTLEALDTERTRADEAEKRERELREAVGKTFREIEHSMKQAAILGNDKMREIRLTTNIVQAAMKALIQPEPDPLVEAVKEVAFHDTEGFSSIEEYAERLRTALAKHGLSIVKGES
jgi:hypothetical protein